MHAFQFSTPSPPNTTSPSESSLAPNNLAVEYAPFQFGTPSPPPTLVRSKSPLDDTVNEPRAFHFGSPSPPQTPKGFPRDGGGERTALHFGALNLGVPLGSSPGELAVGTGDIAGPFDFGTPPTPRPSSLSKHFRSPIASDLPRRALPTLGSNARTTPGRAPPSILRYPESTSRYIRYTFGAVDPGPAPWLTPGHDSSYVLGGPPPPEPSTSVSVFRPSVEQLTLSTLHTDPSDGKPPSPVELDLVGFPAGQGATEISSKSPPLAFDFGFGSPVPGPSDLLSDYDNNADPTLHNDLQLAQIVAHVLDQPRTPDSAATSSLPGESGASRFRTAAGDRSSASSNPRQISSVPPQVYKPVIVATQRYGGLSDPAPRLLHSYSQSHVSFSSIRRINYILLLLASSSPRS